MYRQSCAKYDAKVHVQCLPFQKQKHPSPPSANSRNTLRSTASADGTSTRRRQRRQMLQLLCSSEAAITCGQQPNSSQNCAFRKFPLRTELWTMWSKVVDEVLTDEVHHVARHATLDNNLQCQDTMAEMSGSLFWLLTGVCPFHGSEHRRGICPNSANVKSTKSSQLPNSFSGSDQNNWCTFRSAQ